MVLQYDHALVDQVSEVIGVDLRGSKTMVELDEA